jgi:hypothetical protein
MTSFSYTPLAAMADTLITRFGRSVTVKRYTPTVNGTTGAVTKGAASSTATAYALVLPINGAPSLAFDNRREELALARRELRYLQISAVGCTFEPRPDDEVTIGSDTWLVLGCTPVNPAGTALVYGVGVVKL